MKILNFIKDYWTQIVFFVAIIFFIFNWIRATKCSLRNDILQIYDQCKEKKEISLYQLEAIALSYELYKRLKGNSFVEAIYNEVQKYKKN